MSKVQRLRIVGLAVFLGRGLTSRVAAGPHGERFGHEEPRREEPCPDGWEPVAPTP